MGILLTLKAIGSECGFFKRRVCDTSCWKGPDGLSESASPMPQTKLTLESKLYGVELDGHGGRAGVVGYRVMIVSSELGNRIRGYGVPR
jgi:hypothetical protein